MDDEVDGCIDWMNLIGRDEQSAHRQIFGDAGIEIVSRVQVDVHGDDDPLVFSTGLELIFQSLMALDGTGIDFSVPNGT